MPELGQGFRGTEQHNTPFIGTDLYVKKIAPGSQLGKGYEVDVYENGEKIKTEIYNSKKDVQTLIDQYKEYYDTDRSFLNEMHIHVTYKARQVHEIGDDKNTKKKETSMDIDRDLRKKADYIKELVIKKFNPDLPLKKRVGELGDNSEPIAPVGMGETEPMATDVADPGSMSEPSGSTYDDVKSQVMDTIKKFVESNKNAPNDVLHNSAVKWANDVRRVIEEANRNGADIDAKQLVKELKDEFRDKPEYEFLFNKAASKNSLKKKVSQLNNYLNRERVRTAEVSFNAYLSNKSGEFDRVFEKWANTVELKDVEFGQKFYKYVYAKHAMQASDTLIDKLNWLHRYKEAEHYLDKVNFEYRSYLELWVRWFKKDANDRERVASLNGTIENPNYNVPQLFVGLLQDLFITAMVKEYDDIWKNVEDPVNEDFEQVYETLLKIIYNFIENDSNAYLNFLQGYGIINDNLGKINKYVPNVATIVGDVVIDGDAVTKMIRENYNLDNAKTWLGPLPDDLIEEETSDVPKEETSDVPKEETSDVPKEETSDVPKEVVAV